MRDALRFLLAGVLAIVLPIALLFLTVGLWSIGALYVLGYLP